MDGWRPNAKVRGFRLALYLRFQRAQRPNYLHMIKYLLQPEAVTLLLLTLSDDQTICVQVQDRTRYLPVFEAHSPTAL